MRAIAMKPFAGIAIGLFAVVGLAADPPSPDEFHRQAVEKANAADAAARPRAVKDPRRPAFHFLAPAGWMNDPNGPIFFGGKWHMFYQHNPYGTEWGHMHWGHAVSDELVRWDHWPIAIAPSTDRGEEHCFSGCCVDDHGTPTIVYTSIGPKTPADSNAVQWLAVSTDGMKTWRKHPANPVMTLALHGDLQIKDWRDPFVWKDGDDWFAVLGGHRAGGHGCAMIYKSKDLVHWQFLNVLMEGTEKNWECPNFFKLGDKWVLIYSPHGPVRYYTGTLTKDYKFVPEYQSTLDESQTFYAPTSALAPDGRRILWGWARVKGDGWNGCLTLPRVLTMRPDGRLGIEPAKEMERLPSIDSESRVNTAREISLSKHPADRLELRARITPLKATRFGIRLDAVKDQPANPLAEVDLANKRLTVGKVQTPFELLSGETTLTLHAYLDRSILEVYVNGRTCVTVPLTVKPDPERVPTVFADADMFVDWQARELAAPK
jgi:beta-fructofuranosidase